MDQSSYGDRLRCTYVRALMDYRGDVVFVRGADLYATVREGAAALTLRNVGHEQVAHLIIAKNGQRKGPLVRAGSHGKAAL